ncbi:MAG TPA: hypothetical protein VE709_12425 [Pseudonocardiaceae bacterium]|nr:hypothetical protein [Pseudonocardiaceae bacterium]
MTPSVWFTIAGLAAIAGCALLVSDHGRRTAYSRERRRWAALRGWRFEEADPVLPGRWHHGVIARSGGGGEGRDLVSGRLFTAGGRRQVHVFDHVQGAVADAVVVAAQRRAAPAGIVVEFWLPSVPFPPDAGLDLLGPVGVRYAFADDVAAVRPLLTPELVRTCDDLGADIPVVWLEQDWVLAAAPAGSTPARLERLLRALGEIADQLETSGGDGSSAGPTDPSPPREDSDSPDRNPSR